MKCPISTTTRIQDLPPSQLMACLFILSCLHLISLQELACPTTPTKDRVPQIDSMVLSELIVSEVPVREPPWPKADPYTNHKTAMHTLHILSFRIQLSPLTHRPLGKTKMRDPVGRASVAYCRGRTASPNRPSLHPRSHDPSIRYRHRGTIGTPIRLLLHKTHHESMGFPPHTILSHRPFAIFLERYQHRHSHHLPYLPLSPCHLSSGERMRTVQSTAVSQAY